MQGRAVSEIVSMLIILSLSISSATAVYMVAGRQVNNMNSMLRGELNDINHQLNKPWIHVVELGGQYYLVIINPYDAKLSLDEIIIDNTTVSRGVIVNPHSSLIYRLAGRPNRILVLAGGEIYEAP